MTTAQADVQTHCAPALRLAPPSSHPLAIPNLNRITTLEKTKMSNNTDLSHSSTFTVRNTVWPLEMVSVKILSLRGETG